MNVDDRLPCLLLLVSYYAVPGYVLLEYVTFPPAPSLDFFFLPLPPHSNTLFVEFQRMKEKKRLESSVVRKHFSQAASGALYLWPSFDHDGFVISYHFFNRFAGNSPPLVKMGR